jgi:hypothetical protein
MFSDPRDYCWKSYADRLRGYTRVLCFLSQSELTESETKMTNIYDDSLNNDACHEHVLDARNAGRAWAEREYEAASNESGSNLAGTDWAASENDAAKLVSFGPTSEIADQYEREEELREICKSAARERWNQLTAE